MLSNNRNRAILALIIANIIWGAASPIFKLTLTNLPPFTFAFLRFFLASFLLLPFAWKYLSFEKKDYKKIFLIGFFGVTIHIAFYFLGLQRAPSINAPIIASSGPVFLYLFSLIILHEKHHPKVLAGLIISLIGVLIIVSRPFIEHGLETSILGNLFFVLATLGAVGHAIVSKEILPKYQAVAITYASFIIGSLTFLPFFLYELITFDPFKSIDFTGYSGLLYGIFLSSATAYFLFEWGIKKLQAQEVGLFTYIDPIVTAIIAIPLLNEVVTPTYLVGALFIFSGILFAERHRPTAHHLHTVKHVKG
ncbi:DMT family transporter [Candidatus Gottesmanbacteria bacterium]|nr:DMT family transporter [Candidatus Gottesmanbacteria bacterium]